MQLGMIGLGRMGANMVRRLMQRRSSVRCVRQVARRRCSSWFSENAIGAASLYDLVRKLETAAGGLADGSGRGCRRHHRDLVPHLEAGDIVIDGGNSYYIDDIRRAKELAAKGIHYVDVGTSGGVWGLERGYCMMIGGRSGSVKHLDPIFKTLAPGAGEHSANARARESSAARPSWAICTAGQAAPGIS